LASIDRAAKALAQGRRADLEVTAVGKRVAERLDGHNLTADAPITVSTTVVATTS
jgi:hypothetical protein